MLYKINEDKTRDITMEFIYKIIVDMPFRKKQTTKEFYIKISCESGYLFHSEETMLAQLENNEKLEIVVNIVDMQTSLTEHFDKNIATMFSKTIIHNICCNQYFDINKLV